MRAAARIVFLAAALASPAAGPARAAAPAITATAGQMLALADRLAGGGRAADAERVLTALTGDPDADIRSEARFRLAALLAGQGQKRRGALLLRELLDERPAAARPRLKLAALLVQLGDLAAAQKELRAAQASGLPSEVARLVDRYSAALRERQPLGWSVELAVAPDSNISRSTRADTLGTLLGDFEIGEAGKARSRVGAALRAQAWRRVPLAGGGVDFVVRGAASADLYRQTRFDDVALDVAAGPDLRLGRGRLQIELGAGRRWFGLKPFTDTARIAAHLVQPLGRRTQARLSLTASLTDHKLNDLQDAQSIAAFASVERALSATTGIALSLSGERQAARDPAHATHGWRAGLLGWRELGRATVTASLETGRLVADERLMLFPEARSDRYRRFSLGASFRQMSVAGFAPLVRVSIERNKSNIAIYDYSRRRTEFGIVRAF